MSISAANLEGTLRGIDNSLMEKIYLTRNVTLRALALQHDKLNFFITYRFAVFLASKYQNDSPLHFEEKIQFRNFNLANR